MDQPARRVLVTGGTSGVGLALVRLLAGEGWTVIACGREGTRLSQLRQQLPSVVWRAVDLSDPTEVGRFAAQVRDEFTPMGLINNAAIQDNALLKEQSAARIDIEIRTNLTAPAILAAALSPALARQRGFIVNVTSGLAIAPKSSAAVYCATKAGLRNFSVGLRHQLTGSGVAVIDAVLPLVDTPMTAGRGTGKMAPHAVARLVVRAIKRRTPEVYIGKAAILAAINRLSPILARRVMRAA